MPKSRGRGFDRAPKKRHVIVHKLANVFLLQIEALRLRLTLYIEKLTSNIKN